MNPVRVALLVQLVYLIPSVIYIFVSSQFAAEIGSTPEAVLRFEIAKGIGFVTLSSLLIFGVCWKALSVIKERQLNAQQLREALLRSERHATAGLLAATVAHDARNEITVLKSNNQFLQRQDGLDEELYAEILEEQESALERLIALTSRFTALENKPSADRSDVDISEIAADLLHTLRGHTRIRDCDVSVSSEGQVVVRSHPIMLHQILINLLFNAADAVDGRGVIEIRLSTADDGAAIMEVHDNGPGIPQKDREAIFDAFFTTKSEGSGLGLLSVQTCARAHRGSVEVEKSPLGGACLRVILRDADSPDLQSEETGPVQNPEPTLAAAT